MHWGDQKILLTGGTGSFGQKFVEVMLRKYNPRVIRVYSRDEWKQSEMNRRFSDRRLRFLIGDIRDSDRLHRAMVDIDLVVHAAALKQVPACEYNPIEAVNTNVLGAENIINAALNHDVQRVIALSTDKAVNPVNVYGATKLCAEKLFVAANAYTGYGKTRFSVVRYGNVVGSRGSVIPLFLEQREKGSVTITDSRMTRFWITKEQGVEAVVHCARLMRGGEVLVPKIPTLSILDLADAVAPGCRKQMIGIRPGEKLHEVLFTEDEAPRTWEFGEFYIIEPQHPAYPRRPPKGGRKVSPGFRYSSDSTARRLSAVKLERLLNSLEEEK
jgi:UDP-N-acetylglucosamine 4,6-dehydratase